MNKIQLPNLGSSFLNPGSDPGLRACFYASDMNRLNPITIVCVT